MFYFIFEHFQFWVFCQEKMLLNDDVNKKNKNIKNNCISKEFIESINMRSCAENWLLPDTPLLQTRGRLLWRPLVNNSDLIKYFIIGLIILMHFYILFIFILFRSILSSASVSCRYRRCSFIIPHANQVRENGRRNLFSENWWGVFETKKKKKLDENVLKRHLRIIYFFFSFATLSI